MLRARLSTVAAVEYNQRAAKELVPYVRGIYITCQPSVIDALARWMSENSSLSETSAIDYMTLKGIRNNKTGRAFIVALKGIKMRTPGTRKYLVASWNGIAEHAMLTPDDSPSYLMGEPIRWLVDGAAKVARKRAVKSIERIK
jgi:hypothetical protein